MEVKGRNPQGDGNSSSHRIGQEGLIKLWTQDVTFFLSRDGDVIHHTAQDSGGHCPLTLSPHPVREYPHGVKSGNRETKDECEGGRALCLNAE